MVELPDALAVGADYGLIVMNGAPPVAEQLADFFLSPEGQKLLPKYGFATGKQLTHRTDSLRRHRPRSGRSSDRQARSIASPVKTRCPAFAGHDIPCKRSTA